MEWGGVKKGCQRHCTRHVGAKQGEYFQLRNKSVVNYIKSETRERKRGNCVGYFLQMVLRIKEGNESDGVWTWGTHSEPAAMSRYEVSAVSTPTGTTMLMTFSADQFLSY